MKLCECGCGKAAPIATITNTKHGAVEGQPQRFVHGHNSKAKQATGLASTKKQRSGEQVIALHLMLGCSSESLTPEKKPLQYARKPLIVCLMFCKGGHLATTTVPTGGN